MIETVAIARATTVEGPRATGHLHLRRRPRPRLALAVRRYWAARAGTPLPRGGACCP